MMEHSESGMFKQGESNRVMVPFKYVDFYDVPRLILFQYREHLFLLSSYFDKDKDDHDDDYSIEVLPSSVAQRIEKESWKVLEDLEGRRPLGEIPVKDVIFDQTKRRTLDPGFLDKFLK
jgi:hypothetical protein